MQTCESGITTFNSIIKLNKELESILFKRKNTASIHVLNHLYKYPVINAASLAKAIGISKSTTHKIINEFEHLGILVKSKDQRTGFYEFKKYLDLFR